MRLPEALQTAVDKILQKTSPSALKRASDSLSEDYRQNPSSQGIFSDEAKRLAYLAARFPATFAAVSRVLKEIGEIECKKILDLGAGPGTATWAAFDFFPLLEKSLLVERNPQAVALGKELLLDSSFGKKVDWMLKDLETIEEFPEADLAILSYAFGEVSKMDLLIDRLWKSPIQSLAVIEPGTPLGYQNILRARDRLIHLGAEIIAPCPHRKPCPLKQGDWCHFSVRLERSPLHRLLKKGTLGYEDEKFSYLVVSKVIVPKSCSRILRHPFKGSGHVNLSLCASSGEFIETTISRKNKENYKAARDAEWGDAWIDYTM